MVEGCENAVTGTRPNLLRNKPQSEPVHGNGLSGCIRHQDPHLCIDNHHGR
jgi:hypothetical protein